MGSEPRACKICGCTELDCSGCIERTGKPCSWVGLDLCSACDGEARSIEVPDSLPEKMEFERPCDRLQLSEAIGMNDAGEQKKVAAIVLRKTWDASFSAGYLIQNRKHGEEILEGLRQAIRHYFPSPSDN